MSDVLQKIVQHKRTELAEARARVPLEQVRRRAGVAPPPRDFFTAVAGNRGASGPTAQATRVIAEVKKASPSAGVIRPDFDPVAIARAYQAAGAVAISCLTDERFFQGRLEYLTAIRRAVPLPVLRKDFLIDAYQLYEARAAGADAVLLIAECLDDAALADLLGLAGDLGLAALVEVHDADNLQRVLPHLSAASGAGRLLGINNRDLRTMTVDLAHTLRLLASVPDPGVVVSESGIRTRADLDRLARAGVHAVLVGEHLMRQPDPGAALRALVQGPV